MRRALVACGIGAAAVLTLVLHARRPHSERARPVAGPPPAVQVEPASTDGSTASAPPSLSPPFDGLDLSHVAEDDDSATAPLKLPGGAAAIARLTLDAGLQRAAMTLMAAGRPSEAAVVLMEVATGRVLVYASHVRSGPSRDLCATAEAPSASVFKIVTAATLVERAHLGPDTTECYSGGGEQRIEAADLVEDPRRDRWCTTLGAALGRSVNAVFARLADERLHPDELVEMARRFGYGAPVPFDVPVQPSEEHIPEKRIEFARTAAGFWNTTLSPLEAARISAIVARGGEAVRPRLVAEIVDPEGHALWTAPTSSDGETGPRVVSRDTAEKLSSMMLHTVADGTSFRAFHDGRGVPYLPGIGVAGKTGTLTDASSQRLFSWFTGFAPTRSAPGIPTVAIAALVVNGPSWSLKANVLARDVLRAYFASRGVSTVSAPHAGAPSRARRPGTGR